MAAAATEEKPGASAAGFRFDQIVSWGSASTRTGAAEVGRVGERRRRVTRRRRLRRVEAETTQLSVGSWMRRPLLS